MPQESLTVTEGSPTFLFRLRLFQTFVHDWKERCGSKIDNSNRQEFLDEWRKYQEEQERACPVEDLVLTKPAFVERFFKPGCNEIEGVVVRKSADRLCVITIADSDGLSDGNELILPYDANAFPGLGLTLELGDSLRIFPTGDSDEHKFDFEITRYAMTSLFIIFGSNGLYANATLPRCTLVVKLSNPRHIPPIIIVIFIVFVDASYACVWGDAINQ